jgi:hypothetical protein
MLCHRLQWMAQITNEIDMKARSKRVLKSTNCHQSAQRYFPTLLDQYFGRLFVAVQLCFRTVTTSRHKTI